MPDPTDPDSPTPSPSPAPQAATVTVEQVGVLLGVSRRAAYRAAAAGHIPTIRLGRRILVPTAHLHRMLGLDPTPHATDGGQTHRGAADGTGQAGR